MKKKDIKKLRKFKQTWMIVQTMLFFLPIIGMLIYIPYDISWDQHYVDNVNPRAIEEGYSDGKVTDFADSVVAENDARGTYERKAWKLQHQEIYYLHNLLIALMLSFSFQMFNLIWELKYDDKKNHIQNTKMGYY